MVKNSELIKEILTFPHCVKFDGIDALTTGDFEIMNIPLTSQGDPIKELELAFELFENDELDEKEREILNRIEWPYTQQRRTVFESQI